MDGRRGGSPDLSYGNSVGIARNRSEILGTIHGYYKEALDLLPLEEEMPELLLTGGVCFGLADPITNIIANTLPLDYDKRKRKRETTTRTKASLLSEIVAAGQIAERSLEGLITLLTSYFRYLPTWDALRYLRLAKADMLVAVRLIELDRCCNDQEEEKETFHSSYAAALKYAALSARLPNIDDFLANSCSLASHLRLFTRTVLSDRSCQQLSNEKMCFLSGILKKTKPLLLDKSDNPIVLADERRLQNCHNDSSVDEKVPGGLTISLRSLLLDRIHTHYLKALSRLPMQDLRARCHRALVNGGFCYGPFKSVANNIIVNIVWYDSAFPYLEKFQAGMICTSTFVRVESRSLNGLIKSNLKVRKAIQMARTEGFESNWNVSAYRDAADASFHPEVEAFVRFATRYLPSVQSAVRSLLRTSDSLSPSNILELSTMLSLSNCNSAKPSDAMVANERVGNQKSFLDLECPYSHVNFLANSKVGNNLKLFFAEFSNDDDDDQSFCCIVPYKSKYEVRCCYCEYEGTRIGHPAESYCGGDLDFVKMARGEHDMTNAKIISGGKLASNRVGMCGEDYIYFDPTRDSKLAECMNRTASMTSASWSDIKRIA
uniref:Uncharacterized protein n=1 Tax=Leersia perrieri TaxID=77586 RepID=A0A0D9WTT1_9ORYZ